MYRWVLVTDNGEVVGHLAATPQYYRLNGQRVVAHTPTDYMVLPQYGFHAILLMQKFFRTCHNCIACDMFPEVIGVETRLGAEVAGTLQYAVKLWDVSMLPNLPGSIPMPMLKLINWGLRAIDRALHSNLLGENFNVTVLEEFDEFFDELFERVAAVMPCVPEKDAAFLRWRYGPGSPHSPVIVLGVRGEEGLLGYAVLQVTAKGRENSRDGYIFDLTTIPGQHDVAWALLRKAVCYFRQLGVNLIKYKFLESPTSPQLSTLLRLGFFPANRRRRNTLLVKIADDGLHKVASDTATWSYSIGDGEASFWTY